jgi:hypothetical protein
MASRTAIYRGYEIDILGPTVRDGGWVVMIWPLSKKMPIVMPSDPSETEAIEAAEAVVDEMLDGPHLRK